MILKNKLKKEMLLLKRERTDNYNFFQEKFKSMIPEDSFEILDCDLMNIVWLNLLSLGIESRKKAVELGAVSKEITEEFPIALKQISSLIRDSRLDPIIVLPDSWQRTGGFSINSQELANSLERIMYIYDDDLIVISNDFSNILYISGDRSGEKLYTLDVICFGDKWNSKPNN
ncbi:hypothetical protein FLL45_11905 [Aliikangiella marina]|uniref:Uncharacterized protein n=1 Tax=Aliikangiella marina TaxID=1712262 RepID=A0A545T8P1_9GAMM|nr:hypothetical protein [Aliikangiella marina]TQV73571.1 hypothetical protein FLL45_11905 [Aliikangiella marina]